MDYNAFVQAIGTLGFPIVACVALWYQNMKQSERHQDETKKWASVLEANTSAINKLSDVISGMKHE